MTGGNVTYVMDRLEQQGLVERERSTEDRRIVKARLTVEGRKLVDSVFPQHATAIAQLTSHLEPSEQEELRRLLKRLGTGIAHPTEPA